MSLYIKGIDMPKDGEAVCLIIDDFGQVFKQVSAIDFPKQEAKAIQIPTPHGRLIDADELIDWMRVDMCGTGFQDRAMGVIDNAPTILKAEE